MIDALVPAKVPSRCSCCLFMAQQLHGPCLSSVVTKCTDQVAVAKHRAWWCIQAKKEVEGEAGQQAAAVQAGQLANGDSASATAAHNQVCQPAFLTVQSVPVELIGFWCVCAVVVKSMCLVKAALTLSSSLTLLMID